MSSLVFRGAKIRYVDLRFHKEAGVFVRIHLTAELSQPIIEAMDWGPIPSFIESPPKVSGVLTAQHFTLCPNQKELRKHEVQMECSEVGDFQIFRIRGKDGQATRDELRFEARSSEPGAAAKLEQYLRLIGQSEGALKVSYTAVEQTKLAFDETEPECQACKDEVPFQDGSTTIHAGGKRCEKAPEGEPPGPALASAREVAGSTPARRGRSGQIQDAPGRK